MPSKKVYSEEKCLEQMCNWLKRNEAQIDGLQFEVCCIKGNQNVEKEFLQEKCLFSYRKESFLKNACESCSHEDIRKYIEENVIPACDNQIDKNVRNGDFGEIVVALISQYFYKQEPFKKMRFKLNHKKAAFGTDVLSFDNIKNPSKIIFFESKVRKDLLAKEKLKSGDGEWQYISVVAYKSLSNDFLSARQPMLDYMAQRFDDVDEELSKRYIQLARNYRDMDTKYEIFLFTDMNLPLPDYSVIWESLNSINMDLKPLKLTFVFVEKLHALIEDVWNGCAQRAIDLYGGTN